MQDPSLVPAFTMMGPVGCGSFMSGLPLECWHWGGLNCLSYTSHKLSRTSCTLQGPPVFVPREVTRKPLHLTPALRKKTSPVGCLGPRELP